MTKFEECARVLCEMAAGNPDHVWTDGKPEWTMWTDNARAVIRCLMEVSEGMKQKGALALAGCINYPDTDLPAPVGKTFYAMLQAVLDEGKA